MVEFGAFYMDRHLDHPILFVLDNQHNEYGGFGRIVDESMIGGFKNRFIAGVTCTTAMSARGAIRIILGTKGALNF